MGSFIVNMGDLNIGHGTDELISLGLGSCIGIALYDSTRRIAGLAHVMLPNSSDSKIEYIAPKPILGVKDSDTKNTLRHSLRKQSVTIIGEAFGSHELEELVKRNPEANILFMEESFSPSIDETIAHLTTINKELKIVIITRTGHSSGKLYDYFKEGSAEVITTPLTASKIENILHYVINPKYLKYADIAVPVLVTRMCTLGAAKDKIIAKIAGGSHMFKSLKDNDVMRVGEYNAIAVKRALLKEGIRVSAEDIGKTVGRTVTLHADTGILDIKTIEGHHSI
ncbi:MAG: chemotaxis protein CheD [Nanobdellota archaeon]